MAEETISARFRTDDDTKNTRRFEEVVDVGESKTIGTLYVQKDALTKAFGDLPDGVEVTVRPIKGDDE